MQLRIKCEVQSEVILQRRLEFKSDERTYAFEIDAKGIWNSLTVLAKIPDPSKVQWGTVDAEGPLAPNQAPFNVVGRIDPELFDSVISEIQTLESALSLYMPLRQINWRYPEYEPAYEEGEEHSHLGSVRVSRGKLPPLKMLEKDFVTVFSVALKAQDLTVVASFWREGESDWIAGKFINAFFNYYFVLEGLFANHKTDRKQVKKEMLRSPGFVQIIEKFNKDQHPVDHLRAIAKALNISEAPTTEQVVDLLISTRGLLHHFQNNPHREQGSPLVHDRYEGIAYLARQLAHASIMERTKKIKSAAFAERRA
ncbi:MAG TPA: hypothetical protein VFC10_06135 [Terriglobia bacterium]|nr:hypothetical protein [Terriglobia bacterium]